MHMIINNVSVTPVFALYIAHYNVCRARLVALMLRFINGPFLLKLPYYHQNMTLVLDIFCFYKFYIFLHDNGQVYLS